MACGTRRVRRGDSRLAGLHAGAHGDRRRARRARRRPTPRSRMPVAPASSTAIRRARWLSSPPRPSRPDTVTRRSTRSIARCSTRPTRRIARSRSASVPAVPARARSRVSGTRLRASVAGARPASSRSPLSASRSRWPTRTSVAPQAMQRSRGRRLGIPIDSLYYRAGARSLREDRAAIEVSSKTRRAASRSVGGIVMRPRSTSPRLGDRPALSTVAEVRRRGAVLLHSRRRRSPRRAPSRAPPSPRLRAHRREVACRARARAQGRRPCARGARHAPRSAPCCSGDGR